MIRAMIPFRTNDFLRSTAVPAVLLAVILAPLAMAQSPAPAPKPTGVSVLSRYRPNRFQNRVAAYYQAVWGIDSFNVKAVESGELIRFTYHVVDPEKARTLNDKNIEAFLIAPDAHVKLVIPSLEKVGQLRQSSTPEADRSYWMAFSNPGRPVKRGARVSVVIGPFIAEGLVVE